VSSKESNVKKNVNNAERAVRVVIGLAILSLVFVGPRSPWALFGLMPLLSGLLGWCPTYLVFGFSTRREAKT
jgi:L-fucose isomerase-like protein